MIFYTTLLGVAGLIVAAIALWRLYRIASAKPLCPQCGLTYCPHEPCLMEGVER